MSRGCCPVYCVYTLWLYIHMKCKGRGRRLTAWGVTHGARRNTAMFVYCTWGSGWIRPKRTREFHERGTPVHGVMTVRRVGRLLHSLVLGKKTQKYTSWFWYAESLFYPTTIVCHFRPLLSRAFGRSDKWATLIRQASRQEVTADLCHIE
jgi:hypothetical protein